jgi:hypothetical protein
MAYSREFTTKLTEEYVALELGKVEDEFSSFSAGTAFRLWNVEPPRPREGNIACADGIGWNPGLGAGYYEFIAGEWRKLGMSKMQWEQYIASLDRIAEAIENLECCCNGTGGSGSGTGTGTDPGTGGGGTGGGGGTTVTPVAPTGIYGAASRDSQTHFIVALTVQPDPPGTPLNGTYSITVEYGGTNTVVATTSTSYTGAVSLDVTIPTASAAANSFKIKLVNSAGVWMFQSYISVNPWTG